MAEYIFKALIQERGCDALFTVASAATSAEEIGNDIYPPAKRCLRAHGIPFDRHGARQVTAADFSAYDRIIVMERYNLTNLKRRFGEALCANVTLLMDETGCPRDVSDPWYSGDFETAYRDIEAGCRALVENLTERNTREPSPCVPYDKESL